MLGLDVLTFNALVEHMTRIEYRKMAESTWASATASNAAFTGDNRRLKHLTESWTNPEAAMRPRQSSAAEIGLLDQLAGKR